MHRYTHAIHRCKECVDPYVIELSGFFFWVWAMEDCCFNYWENWLVLLYLPFRLAIPKSSSLYCRHTPAPTFYTYKEIIHFYHSIHLSFLILLYTSNFVLYQVVLSLSPLSLSLCVCGWLCYAFYISFSLCSFWAPLPPHILIFIWFSAIFNRPIELLF